MNLSKQDYNRVLKKFYFYFYVLDTACGKCLLKKSLDSAFKKIGQYKAGTLFLLNAKKPFSI
jgi:hypothetical protein